MWTKMWTSGETGSLDTPIEQGYQGVTTTATTETGARGRNRTTDTRIFNPLLYP